MAFVYAVVFCSCAGFGCVLAAWLIMMPLVQFALLRWCLAVGVGWAVVQITSTALATAPDGWLIAVLFSTTSLIAGWCSLRMSRHSDAIVDRHQPPFQPMSVSFDELSPTDKSRVLDRRVAHIARRNQQ